ncbi:MAG: NADH:flavin oxidoreductase [Proteobacteria bacterium]|nr:NADH:flavin oxidoreductase [Pseudomonadota bacterium]
MPGLFESTFIKNMMLTNRIIRSATWEGLAGENGSVTQRLIDMYVQLSQGGIGLIITGHAYVNPEGQATPWQLGAYSDKLIPGLTEMTKTVHETGGKIIIQLAHAGSYAASLLSGLDPIGPSPVERESELFGKEMTRDNIKKIIQAFSDAAVRSQVAGFDGIQVHGAHGYLMSQFLSPFFNKRKDEYGGDIDNRTRFTMEILEAIRKAVGPDFPVLIKLNSEDFLTDGLTVEDMLYTAAMLEENGIDAIEMSGGTIVSGKNIPSRATKPDSGQPEVYYEAAARQYKKEIRVPLILVGGIRTLETAERLVAEGVADYIALSRPLIREPNLVNRWKSGDRRAAVCVSDNGCFKPCFEGKGICCTVKARLGG